MIAGGQRSVVATEVPEYNQSEEMTEHWLEECRYARNYADVEFDGYGPPLPPLIIRITAEPFDERAVLLELGECGLRQFVFVVADKVDKE